MSQGNTPKRLLEGKPGGGAIGKVSTVEMGGKLGEVKGSGSRKVEKALPG